MSVAPITQARSAPTVHDPSTAPPDQARPAVAEEAHVQDEIVPPTPETPVEDTSSTPTDTGVRVATEATQAR
ncbi:hypothetical protein Syun_015219 [Stephania yunnanensis]|uniref:Uncharacterized protein n=1 Tax=Stephania yunnanensis TaxID=152371 RepID=A0AAP0JL94_9MAGN